MNPNEWAVFFTAIGAVLAALARVIFEVRRTHHAVNSRMDLLLEITAEASLAAGKLAGPDAPEALPGKPESASGRRRRAKPPPG